MPYDGCLHEGWECQGGWHVCNDCTEPLGTRLNVLQPHAAWSCMLCELISKQQDEMDVPYGRPPQFVTKDSGKREAYDSGMVRDTQEGKPRFDLLLVSGVPFESQFLTRLAALLERGATKYGERNWQKANSPEELERFVASGMRHMVQWATGELDEDHAAAVAFNLMAAEYVKWKLQNEDPAL